MKSLIYVGMALWAGLGSPARAEAKVPFKMADCEFSRSEGDDVYKCAAEVVTCLFGWAGEPVTDRFICQPKLSLVCDDGEKFQGRWKQGRFGRNLRIQGILEDGPRSADGPALDILTDASQGNPARLSVYGDNLKGFCSLYSPGDRPPGGGVNP